MTLSLNLFNSGISALISNWSIDKLEAFQERIAIMQHCGNMPKVLAEECAFSTYASISERAELVKMDVRRKKLLEKRDDELNTNNNWISNYKGQEAVDVN